MCELSLARLGGEISEFGSTEERQLLSVVESVLQLVQDKLEEEFAIPAEDGRPSSRALSEQPLHFLRLKCAETLEKKCQSILSSHMTRQDVSAFVRSFLHTLAWGRDFDTKTWEEEEDDEREDGSMSSLFPAVKVPCLQRTLFRAMHSPLFSFSLPLLLLSANPMDKLSKVAMPLLKVFELYSPSLPLSSFSSTGYRVGFLARVIEREIASTESLETVLRTNSVTTKLLDGVSGLPEVAAFRKKILGDIIEKIIADDVGVEVDEARYTNSKAKAAGLSLEACQKKLQRLVEEILQRIVSHTDVPALFARVCRTIFVAVASSFEESIHRSKASKRSEEDSGELSRESSISSTVKVKRPAALTAVGGYVFLRFFCPAITSPHAHGLRPKHARLHGEALRSLVLVAKVVQAIANDTRFIVKDPFLSFLHPFMDEKEALISTYLSSLGSARLEEDTEDSQGSCNRVAQLTSDDISVLYDTMRPLEELKVQDVDRLLKERQLLPRESAKSSPCLDVQMALKAFRPLVENVEGKCSVHVKGGNVHEKSSPTVVLRASGVLSAPDSVASVPLKGLEHIGLRNMLTRSQYKEDGISLKEGDGGVIMEANAVLGDDDEGIFMKRHSGRLCITSSSLYLFHRHDKSTMKEKLDLSRMKRVAISNDAEDNSLIILETDDSKRLLLRDVEEQPRIYEALRSLMSRGRHAPSKTAFRDPVPDLKTSGENGAIMLCRETSSTMSWYLPPSSLPRSIDCNPFTVIDKDGKELCARVYSDGSIFAGESSNSVPHGLGVCLYVDRGQVRGEYSGEFRKGRRHGVGVLQQEGVGSFKGRFENDKKHGLGVLEEHSLASSEEGGPTSRVPVYYRGGVAIPWVEASQLVPDCRTTAKALEVADAARTYARRAEAIARRTIALISK